MIREAVETDIPALVGMWRRHYGTSGHTMVADFDEASVTNTMGRLIDGENSVALVSELQGRIIGAEGIVLFPFPYNAGHLMGAELFWFVEPGNPGSGMRLMRAGEAWARSKGADSLSMGIMENSDPERLARIYERAGYRAYQRAFVKRL